MIGKVPEIRSISDAATESETIWWIELDRAIHVINEVIEVLNTYSHYDERFANSAEYEMTDAFLGIATDYIYHSIETVKAISNYLYEKSFAEKNKPETEAQLDEIVA